MWSLEGGRLGCDRKTDGRGRVGSDEKSLSQVVFSIFKCILLYNFAHSGFKLTEFAHSGFKLTEFAHSGFKLTEFAHSGFKLTEFAHSDF